LGRERPDSQLQRDTAWLASNPASGTDQPARPTNALVGWTPVWVKIEAASSTLAPSPTCQHARRPRSVPPGAAELLDGKSQLPLKGRLASLRGLRIAAGNPSGRPDLQFPTKFLSGCARKEKTDYSSTSTSLICRHESAAAAESGACLGQSIWSAKEESSDSMSKVRLDLGGGPLVRVWSSQACH
jgi:hypothetical protein